MMWFFIFFILLVPQLLLRTDAKSYRPIFIYKRLCAWQRKRATSHDLTTLTDCALIVEAVLNYMHCKNMLLLKAMRFTSSKCFKGKMKGLFEVCQKKIHQ